LWLEPNNPLAFPPTLQAILSADLILIGPGSLYTSILPNLLVPDLAEAIRATRALKFYICNVATQAGETDGYTAGDHARTIERHIGARFIDLIVCNNNFSVNLPGNIDWVQPETGLEGEFATYYSDLVDVEYPWRHDSCKLAQAIIDLYFERTGPPLAKELS
jgi:uncharacterized cofD-like protein